MTKEKKKNVEEAVTKAISDLNTVNGYKNSGVVPYAVLILALLENIVAKLFYKHDISKLAFGAAMKRCV